MVGCMDSSRGTGSQTGRPHVPISFCSGHGVLHMILQQLIEQDGEFQYHWRCQELNLFQLSFADDLLLLCKADVRSVNLFCRGLDLFATLSGLHQPPKKPIDYFQSSFGAPPIEEGGLGIKDILALNRALMSKHLWAVIKQDRTSIWVDWIIQVRLRDCSIWTVKENKGAWGWRKMLSLRQSLMSHIHYRVGNGDSISLWHDPWNPLGPLISRFPRGPQLTSTGLLNKLSVVIKEGQWNWPLITDIACLEITHMLPPFWRARIESVGSLRMAPSKPRQLMNSSTHQDPRMESLRHMITFSFHALFPAVALPLSDSRSHFHGPTGIGNMVFNGRHPDGVESMWLMQHIDLYWHQLSTTSGRNAMQGASSSVADHPRLWASLLWRRLDRGSLVSPYGILFAHLVFIDYGKSLGLARGFPSDLSESPCTREEFNFDGFYELANRVLNGDSEAMANLNSLKDRWEQKFKTSKNPALKSVTGHPSTLFRPRISLLPRRSVRTGTNYVPLTDLVTYPVIRTGIDNHGCSSSSHLGLATSSSQEKEPQESLIPHISDVPAQLLEDLSLDSPKEGPSRNSQENEPLEASIPQNSPVAAGDLAGSELTECRDEDVHI
ncbi:hypothetical protein Sango_2979300 [Sesamum angolense]|uniref:Uncharacterized protein n=1 Tax=Sesamum angolense TaxID=2727404 RepID=A0AAE1T4D8_9LAMI|nr:hypothetical protein Sango_2979300 [Sesamum angolense]